MMTDPIADLLTRIRNAAAIGRRSIDVPHSRVKQMVCEALKREGFLGSVERIEGAPRAKLRIALRYIERGQPVFTEIRRQSSPGRRVYRGSAALPKVAGGIGIAVVSTSRGILSDREARAQKVGGEVLCTVW